MSDLLQNLNTQSKKHDVSSVVEEYHRALRSASRSDLQNKIVACKEANPRWKYSEIARQVGCSHTSVRLTLDDRAAAKVAKVRREEQREQWKTREAMPVIEPATSKRKFRQDAEAKLKWYLRKLIFENVPHYWHRRYIPVDFDACAHLSTLRWGLEQQFIDGMNWGSLGKFWMIGHRISLDNFDLDELLQQRMAFHSSNLIPVKIGKKVKKMPDETVQLEMNRLYNQVRDEDCWRGKVDPTKFEEWEKSRFPTNKPPWGERGKPLDSFVSLDNRIETERNKRLRRMRRRRVLAKEKESLESSKLVESTIPFEQALTTQPTRVALLS